MEMNQETILNNVKVLTGETDETLLSLLIQKSIQEFQVYTNFNDDIPQKYQSLIEDMVIYKYQKQGMEAVQSVTLGSTSTSYLPDYPPNILKQLNKIKTRVRVVFP